MLAYGIKTSTILTLIHFSILIGILIVGRPIVALISVFVVLLYMMIVKRKMNKIVYPDINIIRQMGIKPVNVEYKEGKYSSALKIVNFTYYMGCLAPIALYLGSEVFVYYAEQPYGDISKISNDGLIGLWVVLMLSSTLMPAIYGKIKEANIIFNTLDREERCLRNGLAWEITRDAQKLKLLHDLNKLGKWV